MSHRDSELREIFEAFCVFLIACAAIVHNLFYVPFVMAKIYNWYLMEFLKTGPATWNIMTGVGLLSAWYTATLARKEVGKSNSEKVSSMFGLVIFVWTLLFLAWFFQGKNLVNV